MNDWYKKKNNPATHIEWLWGWTLQSLLNIELNVIQITQKSFKILFLDIHRHLFPTRKKRERKKKQNLKRGQITSKKNSDWHNNKDILNYNDWFIFFSDLLWWSPNLSAISRRMANINAGDIINLIVFSY